jgi:hypothetical protein
MRSHCLFVVMTMAGLGLAAAAAPAGTTNALTRTVSASQQFISYAPQPVLSAELCAVAERAKREWLRVFDLPDKWRDPILIVVHPREGALTNAPAVRAHVQRRERSLQYQIDCMVPPPVRDTDFLAMLVEALCAEYANRNQPIVAGSPYVAAPIPLWLTHGLMASWIGQPEVLLEALRGSLAGGKPGTASSFLATDRVPDEESERVLFTAETWVFVEGLLALPGGTEKIVQFLQELGARKSVSGAFQSVYGAQFPSPEALEKWWSVTVAGRSVSTVAQNLTGTETAERFDELLMIRFPVAEGEKVVPLEDVWRQAEQPWLREILQTRLAELQTLRSVAHPLYLGAIEWQTQAVAELLDGKFSRYRRSSAEARKLRAEADKKCRELAQYLDEVEARDDGTSVWREFSRIFQESETVRRVRVDPIRDYLDQFDK